MKISLRERLTIVVGAVWLVVVVGTILIALNYGWNDFFAIPLVRNACVIFYFTTVPVLFLLTVWDAYKLWGKNPVSNRKNSSEPEEPK